VWSDDPAADLVRIATAAGIGWVLLGPHRAVFGADFRGGVVRAVLDQARSLALSVAVVMHGDDPPFERLFAVVDSGYDGRAALELATRLAQRTECSLHVIRIAREGEPAESELSARLAEAASVVGRRLHTEAIANPSASLIVARTTPGLVIVAATVADQLGLARRGFIDGRPMLLVQGSRFAAAASAGLPDQTRTGGS
jgi:hypothetical protein